MREIKRYLGTKAAAAELALSVGSVQKLVEDGHLEGWRTLGGHRRISIKSIENYKKTNNIKYCNNRYNDKMIIVFCGIDESTLAVFDEASEKYANKFKFVKFRSPLEMLISFKHLEPLVVIFELKNDEIRGLEIVRVMCSMKLNLNTKFILISRKDNKFLDVGAPNTPGVYYLSKPVNDEWFDGFFASILTMRG